MSTFQKFDPDAALRSIRSDGNAPDPAKAAKPAKVAPEPPNFSSFRNFSSPDGERDRNETVPADRQEWADELARDLTRWLSVHPPELWRSARTWNRITPRLERLDVLVSDYLTSGEEGDRRAAVFAANAVAAEAGRIADERGNR